MDRPIGLLLLVVLSIGMVPMLASPPHALADDGELSVSIVSVDDSEYPIVRAVINVDEGGLPLLGLSSDQLTATEGGTSALVRSLSPVIDTETPIALVLVIDTSGSVSGELLEEVRVAAVKLIEQLGPADSAAVISFADQVTVTQTLSLDQAAVIKAIEDLTALGNTALFDAVGVASAMAAVADVPRSAVVLLSDGAEYGGFSAATRESSLAGIEDGAPFYVIGVGDWVDLAYLEEVAGRSGGRYFAAGTASEIDGVYLAIEQLLRSQYLVTLKSTSETTGGEHELTMTVVASEQTATATKRYQTQRPVEPTPVPTVVAAQPVVPVAEATAAPPPLEVPITEPGSSMLPIVLTAAAALLATLLAALFLRRRQSSSRPASLAPSEVDRRPLQAIVTEPVDRTPGYLLPLTAAGVDHEVPLGEGPITIGTAQDCRAQVETCSGVAGQHARIWQRDGRPMLHHVADGYETYVNGSPVGWATLNDGDEIAIGPYRFRFVSQLEFDPVAPREVSA